MPDEEPADPVDQIDPLPCSDAGKVGVSDTKELQTIGQEHSYYVNYSIFYDWELYYNDMLGSGVEQNNVDNCENLFMQE